MNSALTPLSAQERVAFDVGMDRGRVSRLKAQLTSTIHRARLTEEGLLIEPDGTDPLNVGGMLSNLTDIVNAWAEQADETLIDRLSAASAYNDEDTGNRQ